MKLEYRLFDKDEDSDFIIDLLSSHTWPFHVISVQTKGEIRSKIDKGYYNNGEVRTFIISSEDSDIGFVRIYDIENEADSSPLFDVRINPDFQGKGVGTKVVEWMINYIFSNFDKIRRIEGTTREDNTAMQKVFKKAGFTHEATYRKAWHVEGDIYVNSLGYAILREDLNKHL